jgi:hypothetical protein
METQAKFDIESLGRPPELEATDPVSNITASWIQQAAIRSALRAGNESLAVRFAISSGVRDENRLTDLIFNTRHTERQARRLESHERPLIREWLDIRDRVVRPELRTHTAPGAPSTPAPSAPVPTTGTQVNASEVRQTLAMAARQVPGLGITLEELLRRHKVEFGNPPIEVLLAFIRKEAGTHLFDDATAGYWDKKSRKYVPQPKFYELGVFQTPAGLHGCTPSNGSRACAYAAPGKNVEGSQFGKGWYRLTGKYPTKGDWRDPTMQVRIGLWDLFSTGERIAKEFPELFPSRSSEWYLRMAVLYSFSKGAGWTRAYLSRYRNELRSRPEGQRWDFLRGKPASRKDPSSGRTITKPRFDPENVDEKWALALRLRTVRGATN